MRYSIHKITAYFKDNYSPWYLGYGFQGALALGLVPILLPLFVSLQGNAFQAGLVVAAFYFGQLWAPLLGSISDRWQWHFGVYTAGYICLGAGLVCFPLTHDLSLWLLLAFIQGLGVAATNTTSGMYIVEHFPKSQWNGRIGLLQTIYGSGQTLGLLLAAVVSHEVEVAMIIAGLLMVPGLFLGIIKLPHLAASKKTIQKTPKHQYSYGAAFGITPLLRHYYSIGLNACKSLFNIKRHPFGIYILSWFLIMMGNWLIYNLYPLLMLHLYHIPANLASLYFGLGAFLGIFAYPGSSALAKKIGEMPVLIGGSGLCLISLSGMTVLGFTQIAGLNFILVPVFFVLLPLAWSPLIVIGMALTPKLSDLKQGESLGIFNASTAAASLVSALLAGLIAHRWGYAELVVTALVITVCGVVLQGVLVKKNLSA
jgi:MFS family permease